MARILTYFFWPLPKVIAMPLIVDFLRCPAHVTWAIPETPLHKNDYLFCSYASSEALL